MSSRESFVLLEVLQEFIQNAHLEELCLKLWHVLAELSLFINQNLALLPARVSELLSAVHMYASRINL